MNRTSLSILNFNSRSIRNELGELYEILNCSSDILHDIICITETRLNESYPDSLLTNGLPYRVFRHDRNTICSLVILEVEVAQFL